MSSSEAVENKRWMTWTGRVLSGLVALGLVASASGKLMGSEELAKGFTEVYLYPAGVLLWIGVTELLCVLLYAIPQTAVLGGLLLTAYLGGAVATHVRAGDAWVAPVVFGVLVWAGLFLRDPRLRALLPLRRLG